MTGLRGDDHPSSNAARHHWDGRHVGYGTSRARLPLLILDADGNTLEACTGVRQTQSGQARPDLNLAPPTRFRTVVVGWRRSYKGVHLRSWTAEP